VNLSAKQESQMIELEEGLSLCGRCTCGNWVGWITRVDHRTYTIGWMGGEYTTQLRPDLEDEDD
jgi:hypothetical protein